MRAGRLDRRVRLQQATESQSASGQVQRTWADVTEDPLPANVQPLRGNEFWAAQQVNAETVQVFTLRWRAGVTPKDRLLYDGRVFDILDVAEIGRREGLKITAKAAAT